MSRPKGGPYERFDYDLLVGTMRKASRNRKDLQWVADQLGVKPETIVWRSAQLRRRGYSIPKLKRRSKVAFDARFIRRMNLMIEEMGKY